LKDFVEKKRLSFGENLRIVTQMLKILVQVHKKGVYHMDLKPENVLVDDNGQPVLCDFNTSLKSDLIATTVPTLNTEQNWMTLLWASPEQIKAKNLKELRNFAPKTDAYSLSLLILYIFSKQHVLSASLYTEVCNNYTKDEMRKLQADFEIETVFSSIREKFEGSKS